MLDGVEKAGALVTATKAVIGNRETMRNKGKFKGMSLAALEYTAKKFDLQVSGDYKTVAGQVIDLGVMINDHYDVNTLPVEPYQKIRRQINKNPFVIEQFNKYFQVIRSLERGRPEPGDTKRCIDYREKMNLISLGVNCAVAFNFPIEELVTLEPGGGVSPLESAPKWFMALYQTVMALQVADDMVGYKGDSMFRRPSYFTAYGDMSESETNDWREVSKRYELMGRFFRGYVEEAMMIDGTFAYPLVSACKMIFAVYPPLVSLLKTPAFKGISGLIVTKRDRNDS